MKERLARWIQYCVMKVGGASQGNSKPKIVSQMQVAYFYERIYQQEKRDEDNPMIATVREQILDFIYCGKNTKLLDIGCGSGWFLKVAEEEDFETHGVDISKNAIKISRKAASVSEVMVASGESLPFRDNSFDCITILGSLEHFLDMRKGLYEIRRVCRPDGRICILVPNSLYIFGGGTDQPKETLLSLSQWVSLISSSGLKICAVMQDKNPAYKRPLFEDRKLIHILRRLAQRMIWLIMPLSLTCCFIFICRRPAPIR